MVRTRLRMLTGPLWTDHWSSVAGVCFPPHGYGSKNRYQNGTLVSGNMDQILRNVERSLSMFAFAADGFRMWVCVEIWIQTPQSGGCPSNQPQQEDQLQGKALKLGRLSQPQKGTNSKKHPQCVGFPLGLWGRGADRAISGGRSADSRGSRLRRCSRSTRPWEARVSVADGPF